MREEEVFVDEITHRDLTHKLNTLGMHAFALSMHVNYGYKVDAVHFKWSVIDAHLHVAKHD